MNKNKKNLVVFLGGADAEMSAIREVLQQTGIEFVDNQLGWGAKISDYSDRIKEALSSNREVVTIELINDINLKGLVEIDHHGERSTEPASILQVLKLIGIEPTRRQQLIAANDSGYIPAMLALGATPEEVAEIRLLDRSAQGITSEMEAEAERAIANTETINGITVIRMSHSKCATVSDRLFDPSKPQNLLILSGDGESNYYGNGLLCQLLKGEKTGTAPAPWDASQTIETFSNFGGWNGGAGLGDPESYGFWGGYGDQEAIKSFIVDYFAEK
ncbi:MAG: hypothetical protein LBO09_06585 [Candidatus Peribacteria bacterium]|jgi:hypothetical protein|nr:hypothetical protein [Candidatus Peribacteria bacterium]